MRVLKTITALLFTMILVSCSDSAEYTDNGESVVVPVETNMEELGRDDFSYTTSSNDELITDETNPDIPGYVDLVSFRKVVNDSEILLYIELRELLEKYKINQNSIKTNILEYGWRVNFDTNYDDTVSYDISLLHCKFWDSAQDEEIVGIDDEVFQTTAIQHQVSTGQTIAEGSMEVEGNTIVLRYDKNVYEQLKNIKEDTPFHILIEYNNGESYVYDLFPKQ